VVDPIASLGRLVLSLGLIVGVLLLVRHWAQRGRIGIAQAGVRVIARSNLTRGAMVAIVESGGRRFLVGAADHGVQLISELDADEQPADPAAAPPATTTSPLRLGGGGAFPGALSSFHMDGGTTPARPWTGLLDRLRAMTVRTHVQRPSRAPQP
jgi:flagellar biogenesis protein FliO